MYKILSRKANEYAEKRERMTMTRSYMDMPVNQYENRLNLKRGVYSTLFYFKAA